MRAGAAAKRIILVCFGAGVLAAMVAGTALGVDRTVAGWLDPAPPESAVAARRRPAGVRDARALVPVETAPPAPRVEQPAAPPVPVTIVLPSVTRLRLRRARRTLRDLGLRVIAVDPDGEPIPPVDDSYFRVRTMDPPAGTAVPPGSRVRLSARFPMRASFASGY